MRKDDKDKGLELNPEGLDFETETGTRGAIDPSTGAYGTGGTPVTTGDGMSGSTVGVGTEQGEEEYREGDFQGPTPGYEDYEKGTDGEASATVSER